MLLPLGAVGIAAGSQLTGTASLYISRLTQSDELGKKIAHCSALAFAGLCSVGFVVGSGISAYAITTLCFSPPLAILIGVVISVAALGFEVYKWRSMLNHAQSELSTPPLDIRARMYNLWMKEVVTAEEIRQFVLSCTLEQRKALFLTTFSDRGEICNPLTFAIYRHHCRLDIVQTLLEVCPKESKKDLYQYNHFGGTGGISANRSSLNSFFQLSRTSLKTGELAAIIKLIVRSCPDEIKNDVYENSLFNPLVLEDLTQSSLLQEGAIKALVDECPEALRHRLFTDRCLCNILAVSCQPQLAHELWQCCPDDLKDRLLLLEHDGGPVLYQVLQRIPWRTQDPKQILEAVNILLQLCPEDKRDTLLQKGSHSTKQTPLELIRSRKPLNHLESIFL